MSQFTEGTSSSEHLVRRTLQAAEVSSELKATQDKATLGLLGRFWRMIRGYTASDIARVKEGGVRLVEEKSNLKRAETVATIAEAELSFAKAEKTRASAAIDKANEQLRLEQAREVGKKSQLLEAEARRRIAVAEAFERLSAAISVLRLKGGDFALDSNELMELLREGLLEYPVDKDILDLGEEYLK